MANACDAVSQHSAEIIIANAKLQYDAAAQLQNQSLVDNQDFARQAAALMQRSAEDAQTLKHFANLGLLQLGQVGATESQQTVSPVRTGTGDAIVGSVGVSADAVAAAQANLLTSTIPVITAALATAIAQTVAALVPVVVTAAGGASTPSQTQPKPTGAA